MNADDAEPLADDLIARMVAFDEDLMNGSPPTTETPVGPEERWQRLEGCLRQLRQTFPPPADPPVGYPGQPSGTFGRFHIRRELGRGGFGVVFLADDPRLNRSVALKLPRSEAVADAALRARFLTEARAAAALDHPGIVPVYEAGEVGPVCYIAAAYCTGTDLARWIKAQPGPVPPRTAAALVAAVAEAAHHAHAHGILHRDLKPSNILLEPGAGRDGLDFHPRLTDFGLARLLEGDGDQTSSGVVLGTPAYMAPEQAEGRSDRVGAATDIYALGVILYELLTGVVPSRGATLLQTLEQVRSAWPVGVRRLRAGVPRDLETVCLKCLHKEPGRRYPSAADLAADLRHFLAGAPVRARPVGAAELAWFWARRNPAIALLAATVAGLLVVTVAVSIGAALRMAAAAAVARQAERDATEKLYHSSLARARALRLGGYVGQHYESLRALRQAADSARAIGLGPDAVLEARNEAIACLTLADFRVDREWEAYPADCNGITFDARMERYARGHRDGTVSVRRVQDDAELCRFTAGPADAATGRVDLQFGAADRFLAVRGSYPLGWPLSVWELGPAGARRCFEFAGETGPCDFTPDGRSLLVTLTGGVIAVFDLASGQRVRQLPAGPTPYQLAVDPSGRRVAVASEQAPGVQIRDLRTGAVLRELPHEPAVDGQYCHGIAWHPDGKTLAVGACDNHVYLWDTEAGRRVRTLDGHFWSVRAVRFDRAGARLVSSGFDRTVRLWDARTGRQLFVAQSRLAGFGDDRMALMPDGKTVQYGTLTGESVCRELRVHRGFVYRAQFSPRGRLLVAGTDRPRLLDEANGRELATFPRADVADYLFEPDGTALMVFDSEAVRRWPLRDTADGRFELGPPAVVAPARSPARTDRMAWLGPPGRALVFSEERRRVRVLDLRRPDRSTVLEADFPDVCYVSGSPDGRWVAAGVIDGAGGLRIYDAATGRIVKEWQAGYVMPRFSPDGRWLAVATGSLAPAGAACSLWRVGTWELVHTWPAARTSSPAFLDFSPDGRTLAFQCNMTDLRLVDAVRFREVATLQARDPLLLAVVEFSPDGHGLASTTCQDFVQVWDIARLRRDLDDLGLNWEEAE